MARTDPRIVIRARDDSAKAFKSARGNMTGLKAGAAAMTAALATAAGAIGFGALIKSSITSAKELTNWSNTLGVSVEELSRWTFAAEEVGLQGDKIADIMKDSADKIGDAWRFNAGEAKDALESLGIELGDIVNLTPDKQLLMLADRLDLVRTRAEKIHIMEAIGNDLSLMLPLLENGAKGFKELADESDRLGNTLTQSEQEGIKRANDGLRIMQGSAEALGQTLAAELGPAIGNIAQEFADTLPQSIELAKKAIDEFWLVVSPENASLGAQAGEISQEISRLTKEILEYEKMITGGMDGPLWGFDEKIEERRQQIEVLQQRYADLTDQIAAARPSMQIEIGGGEEPQRDQDVFKEGFVDDLKTRQQMYDAAHAHELAKLWEFEDAKTRAVKFGAIERLEFMKKTAMEQTKTVVGEALALTQGVAHQNKALFKINQVAGIANAIINTYQGVTKTLATYPWPLAGAMAGLHLAAGMAQVSAIKSASFNGGSGSTSGVGGGPAAPPSDLGTSFPNQLANASGPREIKITLNGEGTMTRDQAEMIAESLAELIQDGGG